MKIGSLFSGVSGLEIELIKQFGWSLEYVADPNKWCKAVLKYHHPNVENFGSVTTIKPEELPDVDIIIAGTSCQNFSSQGDREGLKGSKSRLFYEFAEIIRVKQPRYVLWENVTGATTHKDFEIIKKVFEEIGYEIDWSIFNAREYAGTIQQRKRVIMLATRKDLEKIGLDRTIPSLKFNEEMQSIEKRLVSVSKSHREEHIDVRLNYGVANTLVTGWACSGQSTKNYILENGTLRDLTINECEALMTWRKDWTKNGIINGELVEIPLRERFKMCGNGVVSEMIPNLLRNLESKND